MNVDFNFNGKISIDITQKRNFEIDLNNLFQKYKAHFHGKIWATEFEECEIIEEEQDGN